MLEAKKCKIGSLSRLSSKLNQPHPLYNNRTFHCQNT